MNHSRGTLVLMEQIIMVMVFALAAALCVQVFVYASLQSRGNDQRDRAVELAQTAAETLKHCGGDVAQAQAAAVERLGGQVSQGSWGVFYDQDWNVIADGAGYAYRLEVRGMPTEVVGLCRSIVRVLRDTETIDDETLFELTVSWQEVNGHA